MYLFTGTDWNLETIDSLYNEIEKIAIDEFKLNVYKNQIEIITFEQMIDAVVSIGVPVIYNHWSYGKSWVERQKKYRKGMEGLAYELVINSNPCINYLLEENSAVIQATVLAHAAFGHNHFFKNNYLFKQWTHADAIVDYLIFAKKYVAECEEKYGASKVEGIIDACHAIMNQSIDRYKRPPKLSLVKEKEKQKERQAYLEHQVNDLWRTIPTKKGIAEPSEEPERFPKDPEENILKFIEKNSPMLESWEREIVRIVRKLAQYFYPQAQTKIMNEGFACFIHWHIMNRLYEKELVSEGTMLEFIRTHSNVLTQPGFDACNYHGLNPYNIGFSMFMDIKRMCTNPTEEDKDFLPDFVNKPWLEVILDIVENYRDESFILQFLSPKVIRDQRLFLLSDKAIDNHYIVDSIHNEYGYKKIREEFARQHEYIHMCPDIQVLNADLKGDRKLTLVYYSKDSLRLTAEDTEEVSKLIKDKLWGYDVEILMERI